MALTKAARSKILSLVQQAKGLLIKEVEDQLQQYYGIRPDGTVLMIEQLTTTESEIIYTARLLRQRLEYLKANLADKTNQEEEVVRQLIREQAFTILNRFASLRMAEERGIIKETIRKEFNSEGFLVFDSITGQGQTTSQYIRYKWYLFGIFDELALDLPSIFDRYSPFALIFPSDQAMKRLLAVINNDEVTLHREEGLQPINLWKEDETIGWIYQYYNSREEITAMREASGAPRNSRELAVRNQFFTPRYVVQFLTDNSLGRIWYEMTGGNTILKAVCPYLIMQPDEVFWRKGESKPEKKKDKTHYIEFRALKDPREISMLDPACGSMHFGLYCFDLFEHIYVEAWDNYPGLLTDLRNSMTRQAFVHQIPELIIRHNIHGVDIDSRALQIAGLSLWLRAQKSFDKQNLPAEQRPQITRSNLVLAEPMPGSMETLSQLIQPLEAPMRKLVLAIWDKMKLAGETGLLLRIEEEIDKTINDIAKELGDEGLKTQLTLGGEEEELQAAEKAALYASKKYRDSFLNSAETEVLKILQQLAESATNGDAYQKLLFADDTARGFAFIELCRKKYDLVEMNPPFGAASINTENYLNDNYSEWGKNILAAFFERMQELIYSDGLVSAIFDRTVAIKSSYEAFRVKCLCGHITAMADTGWNVLDANVETTTAILQKSKDDGSGFFVNILTDETKDLALREVIDKLSKNQQDVRLFIKSSLAFTKLPNSIIGYDFPDYLVQYFNKYKPISAWGFRAKDGHNLIPDDHLRLFWEPSEYTRFKHVYNGGAYSLFYISFRDISLYGNNGYLVESHKSAILRNKDFQLKKGVGYGKRGEIFDCHVLKEDMLFTKEGQTINTMEAGDAIECLSYFNSIIPQYIFNTYAGQHKASGYVNLMPYPKTTKSVSLESFDHVKSILEIKRKYFSFDETCLEFRHLLSQFINNSSLKTTLSKIQTELRSDKEIYLNLIKENDDLWVNRTDLPAEAINLLERYKSKRPIENLISIDGLTDENFDKDPTIAYEIISNLFGVAFGRWNLFSIKNPDLIPPFGDFFDPLPFMPIVSFSEVPKGYPLQVPADGILVSDTKNSQSMVKAIKNCIKSIWENNADNILNEIEEIGEINSVETFISDVNGYFDFHYRRYTKSRREAPIYWPLSTPSGSYTIWIYYPRLTDQTLYRAVSDFVIPKQEEVADDIKKLESNPQLDNNGKRELQDLQGLLHELKEMEKELLSVTALPYSPNHDDGVLITAAPLYKFFRHNKWKSSTEACWKSLEKGEYDWAHLAYSIWPDRVTKKCKKDLSMAVAHGLEEICEVKPKERKEKKTAKVAKKNTQGKLID